MDPAARFPSLEGCAEVPVAQFRLAQSRSASQAASCLAPRRSFAARMCATNAASASITLIGTGQQTCNLPAHTGTGISQILPRNTPRDEYCEAHELLEDSPDVSLSFSSFAARSNRLSRCSEACNDFVNPLQTMYLFFHARRRFSVEKSYCLDAAMTRLTYLSELAGRDVTGFTVVTCEKSL